MEQDIYQKIVISYLDVMMHELSDIQRKISIYHKEHKLLPEIPDKAWGYYNFEERNNLMQWFAKTSLNLCEKIKIAEKYLTKEIGFTQRIRADILGISEFTYSRGKLKQTEFRKI